MGWGWGIQRAGVALTGWTLEAGLSHVVARVRTIVIILLCSSNWF